MCCHHHHQQELGQSLQKTDKQPSKFQVREVGFVDNWKTDFNYNFELVGSKLLIGWFPFFYKFHINLKELLFIQFWMEKVQKLHPDLVGQDAQVALVTIGSTSIDIIIFPWNIVYKFKSRMISNNLFQLIADMTSVRRCILGVTSPTPTTRTLPPFPRSPPKATSSASCRWKISIY